MSDADILSACQTRSSLVSSMLSGDKFAALSAALADPPVGCKDLSTKDLNSKTVQSVLDAVDEQSVDGIVEKLTDKE
ncbi:hypothetical protein TrCOL_g578 [Triparma columacea]|uniref:Uncharacterized protein n=1 Tax=Triparma columacea TaxID=722753 RepID=A0A9W7LA63_9STRA|nr:hypothetical protein TrCOL_g578 [Triparma columacea]